MQIAHGMHMECAYNSLAALLLAGSYFIDDIGSLLRFKNFKKGCIFVRRLGDANSFFGPERIRVVQF